MRTELASRVPSIAWLLDLNKHQPGKEKVDQGARPNLGGVVRGDIVMSWQGGVRGYDWEQGQGEVNSIFPGLLVLGFFKGRLFVGKEKYKGGMNIVMILVSGAVAQSTALTLCRILTIM